MKNLSLLFCRLLLDAVTAAKSYDPESCLSRIAQDLTSDEANEARRFLHWVVANERVFGHSNVRDVWRDWQITKSQIGTKASVKHRLSHDRCYIALRFPSGGVFRFSIARSGETITLGGSNDATIAEEQRRVVADWTEPLSTAEMLPNRLERIRTLAKDCLSVDHLVCKINILKHGYATLVKNTIEAEAMALERAEQVNNETVRLKKLIDHWCPANLLHEGLPNTLVRAFMAATACCADQHRVLNGQQPIRPLDSFPNPMVGFQNTPTGF